MCFDAPVFRTGRDNRRNPDERNHRANKKYRKGAHEFSPKVIHVTKATATGYHKPRGSL
jgi:hypothetical protein